MPQKCYVGVNNVARNVSKVYVGVNGVARNVIKGYIGVNGIAKCFFDNTGAPFYYGVYNQTESSSTLSITNLPFKPVKVFILYTSNNKNETPKMMAFCNTTLYYDNYGYMTSFTSRNYSYSITNDSITIKNTASSSDRYTLFFEGTYSYIIVGEGEQKKVLFGSKNIYSSSSDVTSFSVNVPQFKPTNAMCILYNDSGLYGTSGVINSTKIIVPFSISDYSSLGTTNNSGAISYGADSVTFNSLPSHPFAERYDSQTVEYVIWGD
jgi:hypothetical protein